MQGIKGRAFKIRLCGVPRDPTRSIAGATRYRGPLQSGLGCFARKDMRQKNATFHKRPVQAASKIFFNFLYENMSDSEFSATI